MAHFGQRMRAVLVVWLALFPPLLALNLLTNRDTAMVSVTVRTLWTSALIVPIVVLLTVPIVERTWQTVAARRQRATPGPR